MNIALLFCGRITESIHNENYIQELQKFIIKNNIKSFCALNNEFDISNEFIKLFNVVKSEKYTFVPENLLDANYIKLLDRPTILSLFYAIYLNLEMIKEYQKENNMKFDIVWVTRDDIILEYNIPNIETGVLNILWKTKYGICDHLFYSDFDTMYKLSNIIYNVKKYVDEGIQTPIKIKTGFKFRISAESLLLRHVKRCGIKYNISPFKVCLYRDYIKKV